MMNTPEITASQEKRIIPSTSLRHTTLIKLHIKLSDIPGLVLLVSTTLLGYIPHFLLSHESNVSRFLRSEKKNVMELFTNVELLSHCIMKTE